MKALITSILFFSMCFVSYTQTPNTWFRINNATTHSLTVKPIIRCSGPCEYEILPDVIVPSCPGIPGGCNQNVFTSLPPGCELVGAIILPPGWAPGTGFKLYTPNYPSAITPMPFTCDVHPGSSRWVPGSPINFVNLVSSPGSASAVLFIF